MKHLRSLRRAVALVGILSTLTLSLAGCEDAKGADAEQEHSASEGEGEGHGHGDRELQVTRPIRQDTDLIDDYVCQIRASQRVELRAQERGYLTGQFIDEGKLVKEGDHMFQIMPTLYQAELDVAKAEAQAALIEFNNTKALADKQVVSNNELMLAKAKLDKANAEVDLMQTHLRLTSVNAPFQGIMGRLEVRIGSLLEEGELLTTLTDNRKMWVYFNVSEAQYLAYKQSHADDDAPEQVQLVLANGQIFDQIGTITAIEADFNNETGNIAFRATFPNPKGLLRHGETGKILLTTVEKDAIIIPQKATFEVLEHQFVYVVDENDVIHQRRIKVAHELPHLYVLAEGVDPSERILLDGLNQVRDGDHIIAKDRDPAEVLTELDVPAN